MKKALVLSGGFMHGAFQVGVMQYLLTQLGMKYDIITGISVGAINGAYLAQFKHGEEEEAWTGLNKIWESLKGNKDLYKKWYGGVLWNLPALWKPSLYNSKPLRNLIGDCLDSEKVSESGKILRVGAVGINSGIYKEWGEKDVKNIKKAVEASASYPAVLEPVRIDGELWFDGGVHNVVALNTAIALGADLIDVVVCSTLKPSTLEDRNPKALKTAEQALNLQSDEVIRGDLNQMELINQLVNVGKADNKRYIKYRLFKPDEDLSNNSFEVDPENIRQQRRIGYKIAERVVKEREKEIPLKLK